MQYTTTALLAVLGLSSVAISAPTSQWQDSCSSYPWFIVPYTDSYSCQGTPQTFQPTSGPYDPSITSSGCRSLSDGSSWSEGFESVSINRDACPQQKWAIKLFTEAGCGGSPKVVEVDSCVPAPSGQQFLSFKAVALAK